MTIESYAIKQRIDRAGLWKDRKPILGRLDMELTERCNNNCIHCCINLPAGDLATKNKELSTEEIKRILNEAVLLGCLSVTFSGGEPLLRDDFREFYIFARKLGLKVLLFTNATLINPGLVELFSRIPLLEKIEVTLYGMRKESYEAVSRIPGSFEQVRQGINLLLEKKVPFSVKGALLPGNKSEREEFAAWAQTLPGMDQPPGYAMFFTLRCRRDLGKNPLIKSLRPSLEEGLKMLTRREDLYFRTMRQFCRKFMHPAGEKLFSCGAGCGSGCVDAYGNFQLCMGLRHPDTVYNLKNGFLKEALLNFFPKIREMKATNADYLRRCARCFLKGLCEQCPAKSWMEHGNLDTPVEYLCEIAHTQARFLGLLEQNERAWEVTDWQARIARFVDEEAIYANKS